MLDSVSTVITKPEETANLPRHCSACLNVHSNKSLSNAHMLNIKHMISSTVTTTRRALDDPDDRPLAVAGTAKQWSKS